MALDPSPRCAALHSRVDRARQQGHCRLGHPLQFFKIGVHCNPIGTPPLTFSDIRQAL